MTFLHSDDHVIDVDHAKPDLMHGVDREEPNGTLPRRQAVRQEIMRHEWCLGTDIYCETAMQQVAPESHSIVAF